MYWLMHDARRQAGIVWVNEEAIQESLQPVMGAIPGFLHRDIPEGELPNATGNLTDKKLAAAFEALWRQGATEPPADHPGAGLAGPLSDGPDAESPYRGLAGRS